MADSRFVRAQLVLPVKDMKLAREWYEIAFDFKTTYLHNDADDPEGNYAILKRDGAETHLILDEPPHRHEHPWSQAGTGYLFLLVRGVDQVFEAVQDRKVEITRGLVTENWGARAFKVTDPSGNLILVAEDTSG